MTQINYEKRLPDSEFDVMEAVWSGNGPVNTTYLMDKIGKSKGWKAPTLISFLVRLEERGFITSEKKGKERIYYANAERDVYIKHVTEWFLSTYHDNSFVNLMDSLYSNKKLSENDIDELLNWLKLKY